MTSLRRRSRRPSTWAGSFERSIMPTTVSVTPEAGVESGARTSTPPLPSGHPAARAGPARTKPASVSAAANDSFNIVFLIVLLLRFWVDRETVARWSSGTSVAAEAAARLRHLHHSIGHHLDRNEVARGEYARHGAHVLPPMFEARAKFADRVAGF